MQTENISLHIPASVERLEQAREFLGRCAGSMGVPEELSAKLDLVLEELLVNVGSYAYPDGDGDLELTCTIEQDEGNPLKTFCIYLRDWGVHFNPLDKEAPDVSEDLIDRDIGGLGIYLVTKMADGCFYTRKEDMNEFKACFNMNA